MISMGVLAPHLIGRSNQLKELEQHLQATRRGMGRIVTIAGEAGMGKTRLVHEFVQQARQQGDVELLVGRTYDEEPALPYGPFIDVIRMCVREQGVETIVEAAGPWLSDLAGLVPELRSLVTPVSNNDDTQAQKRRLFEGIAQIIRPLNPEHVRIIVLEDIHWSDQTSQELLRFLARVLIEERILLLATYRADELHRRHPLTSLLAYLTRERLYDEIRLEPLSREALGEMLETMLGRPVSGRFIDVIESHSEGNPFFIEEIVKSLIQNGQLDMLIQGMEQGKSINHLAIPASIKESILTRIAGFDEATTEVLYYAAIVGRRFDFDLLLRLLDMEEAELLRIIDTLVANHIVVEVPDDEDRYRFRHALIREALYDDMLGRERRMKHRKVLQALEERGPEACEIDQLAHHAYQARELEKASQYARMAAERAQRLYAYREAVSGYQLALELDEGDNPLERAELLFQLAQSAYHLGDTSTAMKALREAQPLYEQGGDRLRAGDMARRSARILWERDDFDGAFEVLNTALRMQESEPPSIELGMTYSTFSHVYMVMGRNQESVEWGQKALAIADALGDEIIQAHALNNIGVALASLSGGAQGVSHLQRSLEISKKLGMLLDTARAYINLGGTFTSMGQIGLARQTFSEGIEFAQQFGLEADLGMLLNRLGKLELEAGRWAEAEQLFIRSNRIDLQGLRHFSYGNPYLAEVWFRQGRINEAIGEALRATQDNNEHQADDYMQVAYSVLMRSYAAKNDLEQAAIYLERWWSTWSDHGPIHKLLTWAVDGFELAYQLKRDDMVQAMLDRFDLPIASAICDETWLVPLQYEDIYALVAGHERRYDDAIEHFNRAINLWKEREAPYNEGLSRRRKAELLLQSSNVSKRAEGMRELNAAQGLFTTLGASHELQKISALLREQSQQQRTPAKGNAHASGLTPREQQVIALVARGYSNRAIAEALHIAEKTAEVHVSNILGKLGFTSRAQAAAYAVEWDMLSK